MTAGGPPTTGRPAPGRAVPVALAAAAVLCQIGYPLVDGGARDRLTITTVLLFSAASLSHAWVHRGVRPALAVLAVLAGGGLAVEAVGVATGVPFGSYAYATDRLGWAVADVPLVIPLAWTMLGYPALVVARRITGHRWAGPAAGAIALAAWDLFLDPQMVAEGYWSWAGEGPAALSGIPVTNHLAWLGTAWLMMVVLWPLLPDPSPAARDDRVPIALYLWTWAGSALAHAAFLDLPRSALAGGVGMGAVVAALAAARSRRGSGVGHRRAGTPRHDPVR